MNFVILFLALLWAVAADKDEDEPIPPHPRDQELEEGDPIHLVLPPLREDADQQKPPHLQLRQLQVDGALCLDVDGVGEVTVNVAGDGNLFLNEGATTGECPNSALIATDVDVFCREINGELHQLAAPRGITDWLLARGWVRGACNGKAKWNSARDNSPFYQTYLLLSFAILGSPVQVKLINSIR